MRLAPDLEVTPHQLEAGKQRLVRDAAWSALSGALSGGVILVAFALSLGASSLVIGLLAAVPFLAQAAQLPAIELVERLRQRRKIAVLASAAARTLLFALAALPLAPRQWQLPLLVVLQVVIASLGSVGGCALNAWLHQLIPHGTLGAFFSRRLFWSTVVACIGTLAAGLLVDAYAPERREQAYTLAFLGAALAGYVSSLQLARSPEPPMKDAGPPAPLLARLVVPLRDRNFRSLLRFLGAWNVASNLAAPFIAVFLMRQLGYPLATVTALWVLSQVANALTLYWWGRLSDRLSNKAILAVVLPTFFACILGMVFIDATTDGPWRFALLGVLHIAMGCASGGIGLAAGNLGLKLAPHGHATSYLAAIGLVTAVCGGIAPIAAGAIAQLFEAREFSVVVRWVGISRVSEASVLTFAHWEFVFGLSALVGLYVMHALSRIREGDEISERAVMQAFALEAMSSMKQLSSVGGALGAFFTFERLTERRRFWRPHVPRGVASY